MIGLFRAFLSTWAAKLFFLLLIGVFVVWGVGDVLNSAGGNNAVATVAGRRIEMPEAQDAYRRQLDRVTRMLGGTLEPTPQIRRGVAGQALEALITQAALNAAVTDLGISAPDAAVRQAVFAMPAFRGPSGQFDRAQFTSVLRSNGYTEPRFLDLMRAEIGQKQLVGAIRAGAASPDTLSRAVFAFQQEKRAADAVLFRFDAAPEPEPPSEATLTRWYENHPDLYSTPEYRRIKAVVLSPDAVARGLTIEDADIAAAYEARRAEFTRPERRSVQVLLAQDEAAAGALAAKWSAGADWAAMEKEPGAAPVELSAAMRGEIPAPELADAIFAAAVGTVPPPVKSALGWHVLKVTATEPGGTQTLEAVRPLLRAQLLADRAADLIYDHARKIEDMLSGGTTLDELPGDMGLAALAGTLDQSGNTREGEPAPIPGSPDLRRAMIQAAFVAKPNEPPKLVEAPRPAGAAQSAGASYYALVVEEVSAPAPRPIADIMPAVTAGWRRDAVRRDRDEAATALLNAVKGGQSLPDAATLASLAVSHLPPAGRAAATEGVPAQLINPLFSLKPGEATMVETEDGFTVAQLSAVEAADPNADPLAFGQTRDALTQSIGDDIQRAITFAFRQRGEPKVNRRLADSIAQVE